MNTALKDKPTAFAYQTIAQAEKDKASSSLWVLNNSGGSGKQKGVINITIPEGNGQVHTIRVPVTSIPIDLTTQATKNAILTNPQFRRLVQGRMVAIVSEDHATDLLSTPEAQEEQKRLFSLGYDELPDLQETAPEAVKDLLNENAGTVGGYAMNLAHNNDGNEDDLLSSLRSNADSLNTEELRYIVNNSVHAKVKTEAAKHIVK
jgi:hypothetical protein